MSAFLVILYHCLEDSRNPTFRVPVFKTSPSKTLLEFSKKCWYSFYVAFLNVRRERVEDSSESSVGRVAGLVCSGPGFDVKQHNPKASLSKSCSHLH